MCGPSFSRNIYLVFQFKKPYLDLIDHRSIKSEDLHLDENKPL